MKQGIRVLGVDDAAFQLEHDRTQLVGVVYRGNRFMEEVRIREVEVDGNDATEKLIELFESCRNHRQIKAVMVDGISFAGFNVIDLERAAEELERPVVAVTPNEPDRQLFQNTMERADKNPEEVEGMDEPSRLEVEAGTVHFQYSGADRDEAEKLIRCCLLQGLTPEPVRAADMIGGALRDRTPD